MTATVSEQRPPRNRRAESLPPDQRRAMIIDAVLPLLLEHGEMVTTRQVAEAAGIAEGTIFRVFADKDELLAAVVEHAADPTRQEQAFAAIDLGAPFEAVLTEAVRILQQRTLDMARLMASVGPRHHRRGPLPDRPGLVAVFEANREAITVEPVAAARWLAALTMSTSHPMLSSEPLPADRIVALFLHGVSNEVRPC